MHFAQVTVRCLVAFIIGASGSSSVSPMSNASPHSVNSLFIRCTPSSLTMNSRCLVILMMGGFPCAVGAAYGSLLASPSE